MSGHSKWSQIKHKKAITDAKKGKIFSKMVRLIAVAARAKGKDPESNPTLRTLIDTARSLNMPIENIERAIAKGAGELEGSKIEEFLLEAYGPGGSALLIEGATDNHNRTVSEIKYLLSEHNSKLANPGSVLWMFEHQGSLAVKSSPAKKDELELAAIDAGAQDINWPDGETLEIYTKPEELEKTRKALEEKNIKAGDASLVWTPKNETAIADPKDKERLEKLFEALDDNDDVNEIYSNVNL
ncbi:MAG: YebC/PmpR family DNA-binding transcriptional regulator [Candidatus Portnoybacteria bacterium]|nr:YebC/PmpR family DNA-binding transcriptional regulator [Candidatus Portnoybacteria bacterium]MDD4982705.1 YebC/PmpR family DNA-binding transcriptional regulator [Candidatus Portnoybacteria bacterium]